MATLLRRVSLRRAIAAAAASASSHPEVLPAVFNLFCDFKLGGWVGEWWVPCGMIDVVNSVLPPC